MSQLPNNSDVRQSMYRLAQYAFNKPDTKERRLAFEWLAEHSYNFGHMDDTGCVTHQIMGTPLPVQLFNKEVTMEGIGYVASYPEARGQGGIKPLFTEFFEHAKANDTILSYLAPFSQSFYRQFGYENAIDHRCYRWSKEDFMTLKKAERATYRRGTWNDDTLIDGVKACYCRTLATRHGNTQRKAWWWAYMAQKHPDYHFATVMNDDEVVAYMIYEMTSEFHIVELAYERFEQLLQLLQFAKAHQSTFNTFTYEGPSDEDLRFCFDEGVTLEFKQVPYMMVRIIDLPQFFQIVQPELQPMCFEVHDAYCKWNHGVWEWDGTRLQLTDKAPQFTADITAWTPFFLGIESMKALVYRGQVETNLSYYPTMEAQTIVLSDYF